MVELAMVQQTKEEREAGILAAVKQAFGRTTVRVRVNERGEPQEVNFGDPYGLNYNFIPSATLPDVLIPKLALLKLLNRGHVLKDVGKRVAEHVFYIYAQPNEIDALLELFNKESESEPTFQSR